MEFFKDRGEKLLGDFCIRCGRLKGRNKYFCSQECRAEYLKNKKQCVVCGKYFYASPSSKKKTCSVECEKKNRAKRGQEPTSMMALAKAHKAARSSLNSAPVETNARAKSWVIVSPEGKKYEINNLALWARENEAIIPSSPKLFAAGIRDVKKTMEGRKKKGAHQYKGWTLEAFCEENLARKDFPDPVKRKPRSKMPEEERLKRKRQRARAEYNRKRKNN